MSIEVNHNWKYMLLNWLYFECIPFFFFLLKDNQQSKFRIVMTHHYNEYFSVL